MNHDSSSAPGGAETSPASLRDHLLYFLRLGALGFGGPIALAGHVQKHLVEERRWITQQDYVEGLAFAQLSPGPLAAQLAMYLGWVRARALGATLVGAAFILPSFLMVLLLAALYVHYGCLAWIQAVFYGVGAGVIALIVRSVIKLVRATLKKEVPLWGIFLLVAVVTAWVESEFVWLFLLSGGLFVLLKAPPRFLLRRETLAFSGLQWLVAGAHGTASAGTISAMSLFLREGGRVRLRKRSRNRSFLYGGVVGRFHWLTERQFLDAIAVAMITPGPVVITAAFIGFLVVGPLGAIVASLAVFVPPYLIVVAGAPYYRRLSQNEQVRAFAQGVTAAAVGAIAGAAYILSRRALTDLSTTLIALGTMGALAADKKIPEPLLILGTGIAGLFLFKAAPGVPVVLKEGENTDITLPLHDGTGNLIGAVGLTFRPPPGEKQSDSLRRARAIAREMEEQIPSAKSLFEARE